MLMLQFGFFYILTSLCPTTYYIVSNFILTCIQTRKDYAIIEIHLILSFINAGKYILTQLMQRMRTTFKTLAKRGRNLSRLKTVYM